MISRSYYEHLSVCLSITLMDCDHIVQQKVEIMLCLGYLHAKADPDRSRAIP